MNDIFTNTQLLLNNLTIRPQMTKDQFIEEVYEIAFGDNAINRDFAFDEVIEKLREFSDNALIFEESGFTESELEELSNKRFSNLESTAPDYGVGK
tara:strand:- start:295 stop:582 length:288 start_codon:yes stop_codon:yes gene_type:complete